MTKAAPHPDMNFDVIQTANLGSHFDKSQLPGAGPLQLDVGEVVASIVANPAALAALVQGIAAHATSADLSALQQAGLKTLPAMAAGDANAPVDAGSFFKTSDGFVVEAGAA